MLISSKFVWRNLQTHKTRRIDTLCNITYQRSGSLYIDPNLRTLLYTKSLMLKLLSDVHYEFNEG